MTADDTAGDHLTDAEKAILAEAFGGASPSALLTSRVERILAARAARSGQGEAVAALQRCDRCLVFCAPGLACVSQRPGHVNAERPCRDDARSQAIAAVLAQHNPGSGASCGCGWTADRSVAFEDGLDVPSQWRIHVAERILTALEHSTEATAEGGEVERLRARLAAVEALAEPYIDGPGCRHYAIPLDGDVILAVALDDLRAVLDRDTPNGGEE